MSAKAVVLRGFITIFALAAILLSAASVSAHHGNATGKCVDNVGVITAHFGGWGDRGNLLGDITVKINGQQVDAFKATADNFEKTYKPYANGEYTVRGDWVMDYNRNQRADQGEHFNFENKVTISGCEPKVEKCEVPGKEHLPKDDPACKGKGEDKCDVAGKEHLPKNDPNCKKEEVQGAVTELPKTGNGTGLLVTLPVASALLAMALKARSYRRRNV